MQGVAAGWLPLGDRAIIAIRAYDVLSTHPPLLGQYSASSHVIGEATHSLGPMLYWLLTLPAHVGGVAPALTMGAVNVAAAIAVVALARRRGGRPLMFATGAGVALLGVSLNASIFHDIWNPAAGLLPFTLLIFLAWSLACGEQRLLPVTALVASFVAQCHLALAVPAAFVVALSLGFLGAARPPISRRLLLVTLAVLAVCWAPPLAEQVVHRPGNVERLFEIATADTDTLGLSSGWRSVVHAVGVPPWWLRPPAEGLPRLADVGYTPGAGSLVSALGVILGLAGLTALAFRRGRRDAAAAGVLALALLPALALVTAGTPTSGILFATITYTLWWSSPAGMFVWLALGWLLATQLAPARWSGPLRGRLGAVAGVAGVALVGAAVAAGGEPDRLEEAYDAGRHIASRARAEVPAGAIVLVEGSGVPAGYDLQGGVAFALRGRGIRVLSAALPGLGSRYDPRRTSPDRVLRVSPPGEPLPEGGREIARAVLPPDGKRGRAERTVTVTLAPAD